MVGELAPQLDQEKARMRLCVYVRKGERCLPIATVTAAMAAAVRNRRVIEFL